MTQVLVKHDEIRQWAGARSGNPAIEDRATGSGPLVLRILFAVEPDREAEVRLRIREALAGGRLQSPEGVLTRWELLSNGPGVLRPREIEHAQRLVDSG